MHELKKLRQKLLQFRATPEDEISGPGVDVPQLTLRTRFSRKARIRQIKEYEAAKTNLSSGHLHAEESWAKWDIIWQRARAFMPITLSGGGLLDYSYMDSIDRSILAQKTEELISKAPILGMTAWPEWHNLGNKYDGVRTSDPRLLLDVEELIDHPILETFFAHNEVFRG